LRLGVHKGADRYVSILFAISAPEHWTPTGRVLKPSPIGQPAEPRVWLPSAFQCGPDCPAPRPTATEEYDLSGTSKRNMR
jgi:hypothetical protein